MTGQLSFNEYFNKEFIQRTTFAFFFDLAESLFGINWMVMWLEYWILFSIEDNKIEIEWDYFSLYYWSILFFFSVQCKCALWKITTMYETNQINFVFLNNYITWTLSLKLFNKQYSLRVKDWHEFIAVSMPIVKLCDFGKIFSVNMNLCNGQLVQIFKFYDDIIPLNYRN